MTKSDKSSIFVADSSGIISLLSETDSNHQRALSAKREFEKLTGSVLVPAEVLSETINLVGKKFGHEAALSFYSTIDRSETFFVIDSSKEIRDLTFALLKKQAGSVSFTDCLVMACANQYKSKQIFGFDEIFKKSGYQVP